MVDSSYSYARISGTSIPGFPDPSAFANPSALVPNVFANPAINNDGYVDYEGFVGFPTQHLPPSVIYSGNGSSPSTALIDQSSNVFGNPYNGIFFNSSSNSSGTTVLEGAGYIFGTPESTASGPTAIITVNNGSINTVAYQPTPFVTVPVDPNVSLDVTSNDLAVGSLVAGPGINDQGTVAYIAGTSNSANPSLADTTYSLLTKSSSNVTTTIASTSNSQFKDFFLGGLDVGRGEGPFAKYTLPSINDQGSVAFNADLTAGGKGIFVGNGSSINTIIDTNSGPYSYFSAPTLNNNGVVAFNAGLTTGEAFIYESVNGKLIEIANTGNGSIFKDFRSDVALNQQGDVTFLADLNDGGTAIYTGSRSGLQRVIGVGDSLDGSTVTDLFVSHRGLNDLGQIAFDATLATGGLEVFRADPASVPEPSSSASVLCLAILSIVSYCWRRRRQSAKLACRARLRRGVSTL
ncbi:MAG: hypothetical protein JOZ78_04785 [Chroococcidiopsidaceae cyanobacterium CP_BM_ER_R8_30]|nr:hypothetical protein [Chroococcidiopsidaceae cyanobacterium CP_BM_ER_R8_30]